MIAGVATAGNTIQDSLSKEMNSIKENVGKLGEQMVNRYQKQGSFSGFNKATLDAFQQNSTLIQKQMAALKPSLDVARSATRRFNTLSTSAGD